MATLQRFKLLATQCGVAQSPTRSPTTSPLVQLRRRKTTLRMLLGRRSPSRREQPRNPVSVLVRKSNKSGGGTLKDLFGSPPLDEDEEEEEEEENERRKGKTKEEVLAAVAERWNRGAGIGGAGLGGGPGSTGPVWAGIRKRFLLRRAWRPMLGTIPE